MVNDILTQEGRTGEGEEDIVITVEVPEEAEPAETGSKKEITPDEGIEELKRKLTEAEAKTSEEAKARQEAEERAARAAAEAQKYANDAQNADLRIVDGAIESTTREIARYKEQYKAALASGDVDAAADLNDLMVDAKIKLRQLETGKQTMAARVTSVSEDPVEKFASRLSPRSADWIRKNPDYARDPRKTQEIVAADGLARARGYAADTDGYFAEVEKILGIGHREPVREERVSAPAAAPVSRSAVDTGRPANTIRLTAAEREMARNMEMTDREYAQHKYALQREQRG